jgi:hypothetical protein
MAGSQRWRNLGAAAGAATAVLFAAFDVYQWALAYASDKFHNDFTFYYAAARIGLTRGWQSIYDLHLQQVELDALGSRIHIAELARYISPPPVAWAAAPLTALPYLVALGVWTALLLAALVLTWRLAAPGAGRVRLIFLAAAIGWLPVIYALQLAQPGVLVALGVAACYALLRANRPLWAGVALGTLALKPQLAFLVPVALLVARQNRAFVGSAVTLGVLAVASAIVLGTEGIAAYQARLNFAASVPVNREFTLAPLIGNLAVTRGLQVLIAIWSLALVYRMRRRGLEWIFVPALTGGLLASPYLHLDDFLMLGLAGWLVLRTKTASWTWAYVLGLVIAVEGEPIWGPVPVLAGEILALVLISVAALKADDRDRQHHESEREHDAHLQRDGEQAAADRQADPVDKRVRQA